MICEKCKVEHHVKYGSGRFCSQSCARSFSTLYRRKEINEKVSSKVKSNLEKDGKQALRFDFKCKNCGLRKLIKWSKRNKKFCSISCSQKWRFNKLNPDFEFNKIKAINVGKLSAASQKRRSKNEIYFSELCSLDFKISTNEPFFNGWDADIIIHDLNIAILWNGPWHYIEIMKKGNTLKRIQNRDKIKIKEIVDKGYEPYIVKDEGKENRQFVEHQYEIFKNFVKERVDKCKQDDKVDSVDSG